jgi:hypothetical protein
LKESASSTEGLAALMDGVGVSRSFIMEVKAGRQMAMTRTAIVSPSYRPRALLLRGHRDQTAFGTFLATLAAFHILPRRPTCWL